MAKFIVYRTTYETLVLDAEDAEQACEAATDVHDGAWTVDSQDYEAEENDLDTDVRDEEEDIDLDDDEE
jgi:hypothetical protein